MRGPTMITAVALALGQIGCDQLDRRSGRETGGRLVLSLQAPEVLDWGAQGTIRLALENQGGSATPGARIELYLPGWIEFGSVDPPGTEVTLLSDTAGTRLSYRTTEPLQPGERRMVQQHIRVPDPDRVAAAAAAPRAPAVPGGDTLTPAARPAPTDRVVRARLLSPDGDIVGAEVQAVLAFRGAAPVPAAPFAEPAVDAEARIEADGVGAVRLGMTADELRRREQGARDTVLVGADGRRESGIVAPLAGDRAVIAIVGADGVERIVLRDARLRTAEGFGAGSLLSELSAAYGRACVEGLPDGRAAVWFPRAPGVSFVLDARLSGDQARAQLDAAQLPANARAVELWITRRRDDC
jgi:hypothetical protein